MTVRMLSAPMPRQRAERLAALVEEAGWPVVQAVSAFETDEADDLWQVEAYCAPERLADLRDDPPENPGMALAAWLARLVEDVAPDEQGEADPGFHLAQLPQIDWVKKVQQGLSPVRAGRFFIHGAHDRARRPMNTLNIEIEASQAFGTGHHGTTRGCLLALDWLLKTRRVRPGRGAASHGGRGVRVLDIGAGTGVLAIAAARARVSGPVLAGDMDPLAVETAAQNARRNGAAGIRFFTAPGTRHALVNRLHAPLPRLGVVGRVRPGLARVRAALAASQLPQPPYSRWRVLKRPATDKMPRAGGYDLVFANILSRPLVRLAPELAAQLAPGGFIVLSGLLAPHERYVLNAYLPRGLQLLRRWRLEGWSTLLLRRPRNAS